MKKKVDRLIYLRKALDNIIDNAITDNVMRDRPLSAKDLRESLIYHIDDQLYYYEQDR